MRGRAPWGSRGSAGVRGLRAGGGVGRAAPLRAPAPAGPLRRAAGDSRRWAGPRGAERVAATRTLPGRTDRRTDGGSGGGAGAGALRGGLGFGSGRPGSCAREAGGGLGVLPSTMGLRCPGAHRASVSPVPKVVLGDGRSARSLCSVPRRRRSSPV